MSQFNNVVVTAKRTILLPNCISVVSKLSQYTYVGLFFVCVPTKRISKPYVTRTIVGPGWETVTLAFLVAAGHGVPPEAVQVPGVAQPEVVPGPLQHALLAHHPAGQGHVLPDRGDLVERLPEEGLHPVSRLRKLREQRQQ